MLALEESKDSDNVLSTEVSNFKNKNPEVNQKVLSTVSNFSKIHMSNLNHDEANDISVMD